MKKTENGDGETARRGCKSKRKKRQTAIDNACQGEAKHVGDRARVRGEHKS